MIITSYEFTLIIISYHRTTFRYNNVDNSKWSHAPTKKVSDSSNAGRKEEEGSHIKIKRFNRYVCS